MWHRVGNPCLLLVEAAKVDMIQPVRRHIQARARRRDVRHGSQPEPVPALPWGATLPDTSSVHGSGVSLHVAVWCGSGLCKQCEVESQGRSEGDEGLISAWVEMLVGV